MKTVLTLKNQLTLRRRLLLVTANVAPSSAILVTLIMDVGGDMFHRNVGSYKSHTT
jgi:hypothetical protein